MPTSSTPPVINTTSSYSVSAWVKLTNTSTYQTALCQRDTTGARCAFYLQYSPADNGWTFVSPSSDNANPSAYYSAGVNQTVSTGSWTHLVGVFDATTGNMSLYVNGHLAGTGNDPRPWQAGGPFLIGAADNGSNGTQAQFTGQIADVHVYNTALPPADAADLGDSTPSPTSTDPHQPHRDHVNNGTAMSDRGLPGHLPEEAPPRVSIRSELTQHPHTIAGAEVACPCAQSRLPRGFR
ncbi:LamG domain-containing protein [Streptacidiphilus sp. 4-A2]|nr:LamG domain-containing protein [Streptacidiphilus sp. 4-A2]